MARSKIFTGLLVSVMVAAFFLTGCNQNSQNGNANPASKPAQNPQSSVQPEAVSPSVPDQENTDLNKDGVVNTSTEIGKEEFTFSPSTVADGIQWWAPQDVSSLEVFSKDSGREETAEYYLVGKFLEGKYKDGQIFLVIADPDGPSFYRSYYRFVQQNDKLFLLKNYSETVYEGDGLIMNKIKIDDTYKIPSLDFPKTLKAPQSNAVLEMDSYVNEFFNSSHLKKVFTDKTFGDVYTTAGYPAQTGQNVTVFDHHGFYLRAHDGTVRVYSLKIGFLPESGTPQVTWNDGTVNQESFSATDYGGCGSVNYVSVVSPQLLNVQKDLIPAGKSSLGDVIYELKDGNSSFLKNVYDNEYLTPPNIQKDSFATFLKAHPIFFWVDPFGRLIRFKNGRFVPSAECGKPVIYLYPKTTTNVSVQVEPKGGMTYSDPDYGRGWSVKADPLSNLTNLGTGKVYPYLFWEGRGGIYQQPSTGFVIQKAEVHTFLVEKLAKLGLNSKETADFLEFWEPRMQTAPYYFVTFLGTREMDRLAPLTVNPKPDTVIRVLMDFSPLEQPIKVQGYEIRTPERKGFTLVEWGGVIRE